MRAALFILFLFSFFPALSQAQDAPFHENRYEHGYIQNDFSKKDEKFLYDLSSARLFLLMGRRTDAIETMQSMLETIDDLNGHSRYEHADIALLSFDDDNRYMRYYFPDADAVDFFYTLGLWQSGKLKNAHWTMENITLDIHYAYAIDKVEQALAESEKHRLEIADAFLEEIYDNIIERNAEP